MGKNKTEANKIFNQDKQELRQVIRNPCRRKCRDGPLRMGEMLLLIQQQEPGIMMEMLKKTIWTCDVA